MFFRNIKILTLPVNEHVNGIVPIKKNIHLQMVRIFQSCLPGEVLDPKTQKGKHPGCPVGILRSKKTILFYRCLYDGRH